MVSDCFSEFFTGCALKPHWCDCTQPGAAEVNSRPCTDSMASQTTRFRTGPQAAARFPNAAGAMADVGDHTAIASSQPDGSMLLERPGGVEYDVDPEG